MRQHIREGGEHKPYQLTRQGVIDTTAHRYLCGVFVPQGNALIQTDFESAKHALRYPDAVAEATFCPDCLAELKQQLEDAGRQV